MSVLALALKLSSDCPNGTSPRECPMGQWGVSVPNVPLSRTVPLGQLGQSHGGAIDNPLKIKEWDGWDRRDRRGERDLSRGHTAYLPIKSDLIASLWLSGPPMLPCTRIRHFGKSSDERTKYGIRKRCTARIRPHPDRARRLSDLVKIAPRHGDADVSKQKSCHRSAAARCAYACRHDAKGPCGGA